MDEIDEFPEKNLSKVNEGFFKHASVEAKHILNEKLNNRNGIIVVDHKLTKNRNFSYNVSAKNTPWHLKYGIDERLVKYIDGIELHMMEGVGSINPDYSIESKRNYKVADLFIERRENHENYGYVSITDNDLAKNLVDFNNASSFPIDIRYVYKLNKPMFEILNELKEGQQEDAYFNDDFMMYAWLTDKTENALIPNTYGVGFYRVQDTDGDGVSDVEEIEKGSDPKNAKEFPWTEIQEISEATITNKEQTVVDKNAIKVIEIIPETEDVTVIVDESKLPEGITFENETQKTIAGTVDIKDWGKDEEEREYKIPVTITNKDGSKITKEVTITVQRDTDGDGIPDITDTDDDGDGVSDVEEKEKEKGSDPKSPNSIPQIPINPIEKVDIINGNQKVTDKLPMKDIIIKPENPDVKVTVDESKLPNGAIYDKENNKITGTPDIKDWGKDEEEREYKIPVTITNEDGSKVTKEVTITVKRDTDGDRASNVEEKEKGSEQKNNKNHNSKKPNSTSKNNSDVASIDVSNTGNNSSSSDNNNLDNMGDSVDSNDSNTNIGKDDVSSSKTNDDDNSSSSQKPNNTVEEKYVKKSNGSANKLGNLPKTGDESQTGMYGVLASLSASILLLLGIKKRKKEGTEQD